jgi:predicted nucleotidyltransferase component of viral defense system
VHIEAREYLEQSLKYFDTSSSNPRNLLILQYIVLSLNVGLLEEDMLDLEKLEQIKRIAIIALFSDDDLMDSLVLKGGNAIDIVYKIAQRASLDLDFSIDKEFEEAEIPLIRDKIQKVLKDTFKSNGYEAFDIDFFEVPKRLNSNTPDFWGGYLIEFKIIAALEYESLQSNPHKLRVNAIEVGPNHQRIFKISISKFEYCAHKKEADLDFYTIYIYSPEMIVFEKIRAICQQMPEYKHNTTKTARARDFFDIYTIMEHFDIDFSSTHNIDLVKNIFDAKKVPLSLIGEIHRYREYHRPDFMSVQDTAKSVTKLKTFDFYFEYLLEKCKRLEILWKI